MNANSHETFQLLCDIRNTQLQQAEKIGKMVGQLDSLAGPEGRIKHLENTNVRQWWLTAAIVPLLTTLHVLARKSGINI